MFVCQWRRFFKKPICWGMLLALWLVIFWWIWRDHFFSGEFQGAIDLTLPVLPYLFLVFLAISYEYFYDIRKYHLEELVCIGRDSLFQTQICDFIILVILDVITSVSLYFYHICFYAGRGIHNAALQNYTLRLVMIYIFLPILLAIVLGWAISFIRNRLYGLSAVFVLFYFFDSAFISLILEIAEENYLLWKFGTLFSLFFQSGMGVVRDCYYILSAENIHIYRVLFFIFWAFAAVIALGRRKRMLSCVPFVAGIVMLVLFWQPSGAVYALSGVGNSLDSIHDDQMHYQDTAQSNLDAAKTAASRKDFQISSYDVDMRVTDTLSVHVTLTPDRTDLSEYQLTLYRHYEIKELCDSQGEPLNYEREGDYLLIRNPSHSMESVTIQYSGSSQYFYATSQGMKLPANFAYLPMAGWHMVFREEEFVFSREIQEASAAFSVRLALRSDYPVYSNLLAQSEGKRDGYYRWILEGESNGMTLIGSPYLAQKEIQGVRVVYSILDKDNVPDAAGNIQVYEELFSTLEEEGYSQQGKTFIVSPAGNFDDWCIAADHIFSVPSNESEILDYYRNGTLYIGMDEFLQG